MDEHEQVPVEPKPRRKRRAGKLDERMQTEICAVVGVGASLRAAARLVGCSATAITLLAQRDEAFRERLNAAAVRREILPLQNIRDAGKKSWRASAWLLQRLYPGEYGNLKPDVVTREQMIAMTERFALLVVEMLPAEQRARFPARLAEFLREEEERLLLHEDRQRPPNAAARNLAVPDRSSAEE